MPNTAFRSKVVKAWVPKQFLVNSSKPNVFLVPKDLFIFCLIGTRQG